MSREIREVPPDWQHPEDENGKYISVFDRTFQDAETEWLQNAQLWEKQQHPHQLDSPNYTTHVTDYSHWDERPTDPSRYRPAHLESPSCYQVYETVTGGTPVSPVFQTLRELAEYLVSSGAADTQQAEAFIKEAWVPSSLTKPGLDRVLSTYEAAPYI